MMITTRRFRAGLSLWVLACTETTIHAQDIRDFFCTEVGPNAVSDALGVEVPHSCIDVPFDDGTSTVMVSRCYYTYVPTGCVDVDDSVPLVLDVHGNGGCPKEHSEKSGWRELADEHCFIVVWPTGQIDVPNSGPCWNLPGGLQDSNYNNSLTSVDCCCIDTGNFPASLTSHDSYVDDPLFLRMVIDQAVDDALGASHTLAIDRSRVYMAGTSNGCAASMSMAALYPDAIAAVGCHAGPLTTPFDAGSTSDRVPIWRVHGTADMTVPFEGGFQVDTGSELGFWPALDALEYMAASNGCIGKSEVLVGDDQEGTLHRRDQCKNDATVELLVLPGVGHEPYKFADPETKAITEAIHGPTATIDTTKMAWEFCSSRVKAFTPGPLSAADGEEGESDPAGVGEEGEASDTTASTGEEGEASDTTASTGEEGEASDTTASTGEEGEASDTTSSSGGCPSMQSPRMMVAIVFGSALIASAMASL